jgi:hypothetical protein
MQVSFLLQPIIHWRAAPLGDSVWVTPNAVRWVTALFFIWKLRCKCILSVRIVLCLHSVGFGEKRYVTSPKGYLLIRDAKILDALAYSDLIFALVALRKYF